MNELERNNALFQRTRLEHVGDVALVGNHAEGVGTARYVLYGDLTVRSDLAAATRHLTLVLLSINREESSHIEIDQFVPI